MDIPLDWDFYRGFFLPGSVDFKWGILTGLVYPQAKDKPYSLVLMSELLVDLFGRAGIRGPSIEFREQRGHVVSPYYGTGTCVAVVTSWWAESYYLEQGPVSIDADHAACNLIYKLLCENGAVRTALLQEKSVA